MHTKYMIWVILLLPQQLFSQNSIPELSRRDYYTKIVTDPRVAPDQILIQVETNNYVGWAMTNGNHLPFLFNFPDSLQMTMMHNLTIEKLLSQKVLIFDINDLKQSGLRPVKQRIKYIKRKWTSKEEMVNHFFDWDIESKRYFLKKKYHRNEIAMAFLLSRNFIPFYYDDESGHFCLDLIEESWKEVFKDHRME